MSKIDLNKLAEAVVVEEGRAQQVSIAQIKEIIGVLGRRWRRIGLVKATLEFMAIFKRAGKGKTPRRRPY